MPSPPSSSALSLLLPPSSLSWRLLLLPQPRLLQPLPTVCIHYHRSNHYYRYYHYLQSAKHVVIYQPPRLPVIHRRHNREPSPLPVTSAIGDGYYSCRSLPPLVTVLRVSFEKYLYFLKFFLIYRTWYYHIKWNIQINTKHGNVISKNLISENWIPLIWEYCIHVSNTSSRNVLYLFQFSSISHTLLFKLSLSTAFPT